MYTFLFAHDTLWSFSGPLWFCCMTVAFFLMRAEVMNKHILLLLPRCWHITSLVWSSFILLLVAGCWLLFDSL
jgi:hypothetical protein